MLLKKSKHKQEGNKIETLRNSSKETNLPCIFPSRNEGGEKGTNLRNAMLNANGVSGETIPFMCVYIHKYNWENTKTRGRLLSRDRLRFGSKLIL